ncbi:WhiB family transcriptional regulator [Amycolatopsis alba]|uniref:4Fe-4S Wbl-type domain-containing protein n=1 Tax=Amycolatopsis alba DSM 44262 TaxID=1125972 RepID=A0A229R9X3_AMYAL|nr:hypothetical protein CFP75_38445 [Amycolatopsis alba DSM 44262]
MKHPNAPHDRNWHRHAACRDKPNLDWHSDEPVIRQRCLAICRNCTVRAPCGDTAISLRDPWGIWGGQSPDERDRLAGDEHLRILPPHGNNSRYVKHSCRCDACRAGHTSYEHARRQSASQQELQEPRTPLLQGNPLD